MQGRLKVGALHAPQYCQLLLQQEEQVTGNAFEGGCLDPRRGMHGQWHSQHNH
jgi:hypothetical protein